MARKQMSVSIEESLQEAFKKKCKSAGMKYSEAIEALLQSYVDGKLDVKVNTYYDVISKGMEK